MQSQMIRRRMNPRHPTPFPNHLHRHHLPPLRFLLTDFLVQHEMAPMPHESNVLLDPSSTNSPTPMSL